MMNTNNDRMKAVFISFTQAYFEFILEIFDHQNIRGYTYWEEVCGRGSNNGDPHMGTHTWPVLNGAIMVIVHEDKVNTLLSALHELDLKVESQGLRAFVWSVEQSI